MVIPVLRRLRRTDFKASLCYKARLSIKRKKN